MRQILLVFIIFVGGIFYACSQTDEDFNLFQQMNSDDTGISFSNDLMQQEAVDLFRSRYFYNGAGVGIGDFNNDGLQDVYFVANQKDNKLFLNQGDFEFDDVTENAGVAGEKPWSAGVTIADVNGDGWLDIYVLNSGDSEDGDRKNELFINNKDGTFSEKAEEFGLADSGFSTHAAFFDYDNDGDLDCYVLNNSSQPITSLSGKNLRNERDEEGGDRFYENRDGRFVDVSEEVGIYGSVIAFGLSVTLVDVNRDGWTDIYISNDFFERDYLYINQKGEGFTEELELRMDQISLASMGADAEDLNNDGWPEIFVTEMLPEEMERLKQITSFESHRAFEQNVNRGYYNQFQRNTLQLNDHGNFLEIGRYANVYATDWSWSGLIFDMNNSSQKEIFVTNGVFRDVTDQDFLDFMGSEENIRALREGKEIDFEDIADHIPSTPIPNYAFALDSALVYQNKAEEWGVGTPSFSNGVSIGDLDNDGDLDMIVNNLNQESFVYQNQSEEFYDHHYVNIKLEGDRKNPFAIGASVSAFIGDEQISRYQYPSRGFQSSVSQNLLLGLGEASQIDSLAIQWDHQRSSVFYDVPVDTQLTFSVKNSETVKDDESELREKIFREVDFNHSHTENEFDDFNQSGLLHHRLSREGPPVAVADVNNDGNDDFYIGGAAGSEGSLFLNTGEGDFEKLSVPAFQKNAAIEEVDALFFDADGDGDKDLYVVSGGNEVGSNRQKFKDRLYINESEGNENPSFRMSDGLPDLYASGSVVKANDFDDDGDLDLFIGSRSIPGEYGKSPESYLLQNDGNGNFANVTSTYISQLRDIGMVTDAEWVDYDNDGDEDLVLLGDWMGITIFENRGEFFQQQFDVEGLEKTAGWWKSISSTDINDDGHIDFVAGNLGQNSIYKATKDSPLRLYFDDFDRDGSYDHILTFKQGDNFYPFVVKDQLARQLPFIDAKFNSHEEYADESVSDIFSENQLNSAEQLNAYILSSVVVFNNGDESYSVKELPKEAQFSMISAIAVDDFTGDGTRELLLMGNFSGTRPMEGFYDANHGLLYDINEDGGFSKIPTPKTGLNIRGDVRDIEIGESESGKFLIVGKNDDQTQIYTY